MDAVDNWSTLSVENRLMICGSLFEAEKATLTMIAPKDYSSDEVLSFVFYHLYGEELPEDFFVQRQRWLERKHGRKKGE